MTGFKMDSVKTLKTDYRIVDHYQSNSLMDRIEQSLKEGGRSIKELNQNDLKSFDELHIGGQEFTRELAKFVDLSRNSLMLDVGSGLGGPARFLAKEYGATVIGVDLTEEFCRTALKLNKIVGFPGRMNFINGDATILPFKDQKFNCVWSQHCSMNIPNKPGFYSELFRVLKPGGKLVVHDITAGENPNICFPVPWSSSPENSHLVDWQITADLLTKCGFSTVFSNDITEKAKQWFLRPQKKNSDNEKSVSRISQMVVFGSDLKRMVKNLRYNLEEDCIKVFEAVYEK